jgi:hypothetical protein
MVRIPDLPERLAQSVAERVVALVVDAVDVNALIARVDVDALLARVDLPALLARVDVEALLDRVDLDALLDRVDIERLLRRVDLASTVTSTASGVAESGLVALRRSAARGDELTARWANRLVGRS